MEDFVKIAVEKNASDLHLVAGRAAAIRVNSTLTIITESDMTNFDEVISSILTDAQKSRISEEKQLDFALTFGNQRLRANIYQSRSGLSASFRLIPTIIPDKSILNLPAVLDKLIDKTSGIVFVTGPTGSGKTTTIAALVDQINKTKSKHILTIEDPIEYIYQPASSIVSQREVGENTNSWNDALRVAMRQDPDVIVVGEIRDLESLDTALTLAETGHLVFTTLHAYSTTQAIERMNSLYPPHHQDSFRYRLAMSMSAITSQRLIPTINDGRHLVSELMFATSAVTNLIRENKFFQIDNVITTSSLEGMKLLEDDIYSLLTSGQITQQTALTYAVRKNELLKKIS